MKVAIVLTHHLSSNQKYLDLALMGIQEQTHKDWACFVISDAETAPQVPHDSRIYLHHDKGVGNASQKLDFALRKFITQDFDFLLMHSDDVVMGTNCLERMLVFHGNDPKPLIMNPCSNSDMGTRFTAPMHLVKDDGRSITLKPDMAFEDLCFEWLDEIKAFNLNAPILVTQEYVPFFCTLVPLSMMRLIGNLDERLDVRHNDQDYCMRATQRGIIPVINFAAFALHFGSKTIYQAHKPEEFDEATRIFSQKWGNKK